MHGLKRKDLFKSIEHDKFNDFLPWIAQDPDSGKILTQEGAIGYVWECTPQPFISNKTADILTGILTLEYTSRATVQFILYADDHIQPLSQAFLDQGVRKHPVLDEWAQHYAEYLDSLSDGNEKMSGIPLRNYRLFVCVKNGYKEEEISEDTIRGIEEYLSGSGLHPAKMSAADLLQIARGILGSQPLKSYDPDCPIRKQVLGAEDNVDVYHDYMRIGKRYARVMSPKTLPESIDVLKANELFGGFLGAQSDSSQILTPFIYSLTILPKDVSAGIAAKLEMMNFQRSKGSFLNQVLKRIEEFDWALGQSDKTSFIRMIPSMVILADSKESLANSTSRLRRLWESKGAAMQEETIIKQVMLLSSLPLGYINVGNFTERLDRYFIAPLEVVARFIPVQADFKGIMPPVIPLIGRKGQLIGYNIFNRRAANKNMLIAAGSGSGKSFLTQYILLCEYRNGKKVRLIDIGYSYLKLTKILGKTYIDIKDDFVLNPFDSLASETDLEGVKPIIATMCYSYGKGSPDEIDLNLISQACEWAYAQGDPDNGVTLVSEYLRQYPKFTEDPDGHHVDLIVKKAHTLAFTMREFVGDGQYAKYVHGKSTLDMDRDDWMVLELEGLMTRPALFSVVILMVINLITRSLYLAPPEDRVPTFILFDEAWKFLNKVGSSSEMVARVIEEGFRRARKNDGSFGIVTQSINDAADKFGTVGEVILAQTQYKLLLNDEGYNKARERGTIDYDPFVMKLLTSVTSQLPRYSEIFIDGGEATGIGVGRLCIDNYSYLLFSSDPEDNRKIAQIVKQGVGYDQAIKQLVAA